MQKIMLRLLTHNKTQLILASFLMLFIELALIRWTGSNILYFSYFSNFILLGSFLGIGIGFLRTASTNNLFAWSPICLAFFILFVASFPVHIEYSGKEFLFFSNYKRTGFPIWITLPVIFFMVTITMAAIARGVADLFHKFIPLQAYRLDIFGSITGILIFSILSFVNAAPIFWGVIVCLVFALLFLPEWKHIDRIALLQMAALCLIIGTLNHESSTPGSFWSPYSKITMVHDEPNHAYTIFVNGIPYQSINSVAQHKLLEPFYWLPYQHRAGKTPLNKVLIIGAGTGNDVAIALAEGAKSIDAVDIDPVIYKLGSLYHPNQPYANPNVHVFINDGRAFLQQTKTLYDLIIFALTDSHSLISGQSSLRLESYIYTKEAMLAVRKHLKPDGIFAMYNFYRQPWIVDRLATTMQLIFMHSPCMDTSGPSDIWRTVLTTSLDSNALNCTNYWQPLVNTYIAPATDDHPFLYLKENRIPVMYSIVLFLILLTAFTIIGIMNKSLMIIHQYADLFCMGAAFLLLETKSIATFSLLFGTTWLVNALVFAGILLTVYGAIEVSRVFTQLRRYSVLLYGLLLLSLMIAWLIPANRLLILPLLFRYVAATCLLFVPVFFANLIFADRFKNAWNSTTAFGVNLIGAMLGGVLEYLALVVGYRDLLIIIAILYGLAFLFEKKLSLQKS
jgi:SAM-dependent methyltransferase